MFPSEPHMGYVTLVFPNGEDLVQRELKEIIAKAREIGLGYKFTSSSLFIEWVGTSEQANKLKEFIIILNSTYKVEWRAK